MMTRCFAVDSYGAACCSGDGDQILKFCPAFHIVHLISQVQTQAREKTNQKAASFTTLAVKSAYGYNQKPTQEGK